MGHKYAGAGQRNYCSNEMKHGIVLKIHALDDPTVIAFLFQECVVAVEKRLRPINTASFVDHCDSGDTYRGKWPSLTTTVVGACRAVLLDQPSASDTGGLQAQPAQLFLSAKSPLTFAVLDDPAE